MKKPAALFLTVSLAAALLTPPLKAEDTNHPQKLFPVIRDYLARDIFVKEGVGLKRVRLGHSFDSARRAWGKPVRVEQTSIYGDQRWLYRADRDTEIQLAGRQSITTMAFRGSSTSQYQTAAGARFGMPPLQVRGIYGSSWLIKSGDTLEYPTQGIRFYFTSRSLRVFEIFAPKKR